MPEATALQHQRRQEFGARVRYLRRERGLSQETLAHVAGLDRSYVGQVERGERNVSLDNIHRIADAIECAVGDLF